MNHLEKYNFLIKLAANMRAAAGVNPPVVSDRSQLAANNPVTPLSKQPVPQQPIPQAARPSARPSVLPGTPVSSNYVRERKSGKPAWIEDDNPQHGLLSLDSASSVEPTTPLNSNGPVASNIPNGNKLTRVPGMNDIIYSRMSKTYSDYGHGNFDALTAQQQNRMYQNYSDNLGGSTRQ